MSGQKQEVERNCIYVCIDVTEVIPCYSALLTLTYTTDAKLILLP